MQNRVTLGSYRQRLALQAPDGPPVPDPGGDQANSFVTRTTVYAEIRPLSGRELVNAQQTKGTVDTRIRFRFLVGIDATWRGLWNGQVYNFVSVLDRENRRIELEVFAVATEINT